jgi:hypothetical protein
LQVVEDTSSYFDVTTNCTTIRLLSDFDATINYCCGFIHSSDTVDNQQVAGVSERKNKSRNQRRNRNPDRSDKSKKVSKGLGPNLWKDEWFSLDENVCNKISKMRKKRTIAAEKTVAKKKN